MDDVRATLILLPGQALPAAADVADAGALVYVPDADDLAASAEQIRAAIELGPPLYIALPPLEEGSLREYLGGLLAPGVYGVASRTPRSVEQLRYVESLLEELEIRAGIQPGLTAMAVGFEHPRALAIMGEALRAMRDSADRMTWIAFNHEELALELGVAPDSATITAASAQVVLTAAAFELPVVYDDAALAESAAAMGFRGCATIETSDIARLREVFARSEPEQAEEES